jgi:hypothetical protein
MAGHSYFTEGSAPSRASRHDTSHDTSPSQHETPERAESTAVIADMVAVLSGKEHGSTAQALAFLRQVYPRYPLTLRLAALVAYSKACSTAPPHLQ